MEADKLTDSPMASASEEEEQIPDLPNRKRKKKFWIVSMVVAGLLLVVLIVPLAVVYSRPHSHSLPAPNISEALAAPWSINNFKQLVSFGDSYTDEGRAETIGIMGDNPQPPGWVPPITDETADGGYVWPRYVNWYTGVKLYNYAVGGAVCSSKIVANVGVGVLENEIPTFLADKGVQSYGEPFITIGKNDTVFSIWIGTNDFGPGGFLMDNQVSPSTLTNYIDCVYTALDSMYAVGARKMVLMNLIPLNLTPLYGMPGKGGLSWSVYWQSKPYVNATAASLKMRDMVLSANSEFESRTNQIINERKRYPAARIALFDTWSLFNDIYNNPAKFLNGTAPLNVTSSVRRVFPNGTTITSLNPDSYEWYDDLHPSEQSERHVAMEFVKVASGNSSYANYWP